MWIGALWLLLRFTAPGDTSIPGTVVQCKSYVVEAKDSYGYTWNPTAYDVRQIHTPVPRRPGAKDSIYVFMSEDQRVRLYRVSALDSSGNQARWSNIISAVAYGKQVWWRPQPPSVWP